VGQVYDCMVSLYEQKLRDFDIRLSNNLSLRTRRVVPESTNIYD
jgi:hypothetical protein